jgi:hypothetical protein
MNDQDRTELERLLAAARPAGPSAELDARVRETMCEGGVVLPKRRERQSERNRWLAVAASVLLAAGIGFVGGRLSADAGKSDSDRGVALRATESSHAASQESEPISRAPSLAAAQATVIPLPEERLAGLFIPSQSREGLLGAGPVTVEVSGAR